MATEELYVVEFKEPGSNAWQQLNANGAPLLFRDEQEVSTAELQRIVNSQRVVSPGPCEFRWKPRRLSK